MLSHRTPVSIGRGAAAPFAAAAFAAMILQTSVAGAAYGDFCAGAQACTRGAPAREIQGGDANDEAVDPDPLKPLGHFGGYSFDVEVAGHYAYYGAGLRLMVVDVNDPTRPAIVGTSEYIDRPITSVAKIPGHIVVSTCFEFYAFDVSVPTAPSLFPGPPGLGPSDPCVIHSDGTRILALADEGLEIYDYSDPARPRIAAEVALPYGARTMYVTTGRAYVVEGKGSGLHILDTSDPTDVSELGYVELTDAAGVPYIDVDGNRAYVCVGRRLTTIDVSDPRRPIELGVSATDWCDGLRVVDGLLYFIAGGAGDFKSDAEIDVIDASDPLDVESVGGLVFQGANHIKDIEAIDDFALVVTETRLWTLSISEPESPRTLQVLPTIQAPEHIAAVGHYLYLVDRPGDVWVYDVAVPTEPQLVGYTDVTAGFVEDMLIDGKYAYLGCVGEYVVIILSLADPSSPEVVGRIDAGHGWRLAKEGDLLYVLPAAEGRLRVYDVEDPSTPRLVGEANDMVEGLAPNDIVVSGGRAYIAEWDTPRLVVVDVSDPESMHRVASMPWEREIYALQMHAGLLLALEWYGGLQILDVSDPSTPEKLGYWFLGQGADLVTNGDVAYVARGVWRGSYYPWHRQVVKLDLRDPLHPVPAGAIDVNGAYKVALAEGTDRLYAAGLFTGAFILRRDDRLGEPGRPFWLFHPAALADAVHFGEEPVPSTSRRFTPSPPTAPHAVWPGTRLSCGASLKGSPMGGPRKVELAPGNPPGDC